MLWIFSVYEFHKDGVWPAPRLDWDPRRRLLRVTGAPWARKPKPCDWWDGRPLEGAGQYGVRLTAKTGEDPWPRATYRIEEAEGNAPPKVTVVEAAGWTPNPALGSEVPVAVMSQEELDKPCCVSRRPVPTPLEPWAPEVKAAWDAYNATHGPDTFPPLRNTRNLRSR